MKYSNTTTSTLLALILVGIAACSSGPAPDKIDPDKDLSCTRNGAPAPEWVCKNVVGDDMQTAVGSSEFSRIGNNFMLREATSDGQKAMQKVVHDYIEDRLMSFSRQIGGEVSTATDKIINQIATKVSEEKKEDYKQIKLWSNPNNGSIEVLMAIQNKNINRDVRRELMLELKKDETLYEAFKKNDGEDLLDEFLPLD